MPYIEKTGVKSIKQQLYQWFHVMTDPRIDGFNGFACKQECNRLLEQEECPTYAGEDEYLDNLREERAVARLQGTDKGVPYVS